MTHYLYRIPITGYCLVEVEAETEHEAKVKVRQMMDDTDLDIHEWEYADSPKLYSITEDK